MSTDECRAKEGKSCNCDRCRLYRVSSVLSRDIAWLKAKIKASEAETNSPPKRK